MSVLMSLDFPVFPLKAPFTITGYTFTQMQAIWATLEHDGYRGRGEAQGLYYQGDTPESMAAELESVRKEVEKGASRDDIHQLLRPGGARNALDCAMWDLECKKFGSTIWKLLGLSPRPLTTVATIGIGEPEEMAQQAKRYFDFSQLKVKLDGDQPIEKLRAIRAARPDATLVIDVNQGWNMAQLRDYTPALVQLNIALIEQPLPRGGDHDLEGYVSPIPIGADESCLDLAQYRLVKDRYDVINIKLDKSGGLTEALAIAHEAKQDGKALMVGNMTGTSLAMAPSYVIGQYCQFVDIDGPVLLGEDVRNGLSYGDGGEVTLPSPLLWG